MTIHASTKTPSVIQTMVATSLRIPSSSIPPMATSSFARLARVWASERWCYDETHQADKEAIIDGVLRAPGQIMLVADDVEIPDAHVQAMNVIPRVSQMIHAERIAKGEPPDPPGKPPTPLKGPKHGKAQ